MTHKHIMEKASKALKKDAKHYSEEMKHDKGIKKKHDRVEMKEALSAAQAMKKRARKSHEY